MLILIIVHSNSIHLSLKKDGYLKKEDHLYQIGKKGQISKDSIKKMLDIFIDNIKYYSKYFNSLFTIYQDSEYKYFKNFFFNMMPRLN